MFKVNDYVVYGTTGVCQIADIKKDEFSNNNETEYYVLNPVFDGNNMTIMIPVNHPNRAMRAVCTKKEALSLIAQMHEIETAWIGDERQRNADFKASLRSGKNEEWAKIVATIYLEKEARSGFGRKIAKSDEDIFRSAEKCLHQEFAVALNISPDEVPSFIRSHSPAQ
ncbi:MAG: CarD family transcriptional regulator [Solirubrobacterales bacterium]